MTGPGRLFSASAGVSTERSRKRAAGGARRKAGQVKREKDHAQRDTSATTSRNTRKAADEPLGVRSPASTPRLRALRPSSMKSSRLLPLIVACALFIENMDSTVLVDVAAGDRRDLATDPDRAEARAHDVSAGARRVHPHQWLGRGPLRRPRDVRLRDRRVPAGLDRLCALSDSLGALVAAASCKAPAAR